ncbi:MAG: hypothetical protein M3R61_06825 [Chloroflexota bacterium]|nr:hypothetical protein [Chloroflexota bacterium]
MLRYWKRWILLLLSCVAFVYLFFWIYQTYRLHSYPYQAADNILIHAKSRLINKETIAVEKCKYVYINRYYATDSDWSEVVSFYDAYAQSSSWLSDENEGHYFYQGFRDAISFTVGHIEKPAGAPDTGVFVMGKTIYVISVSYQQEMSDPNRELTVRLFFQA